MKTIMLTAPSSGSGKTTITMGIVRALKNRGYDVSCFKTGPDYIDTAFLKAASGRTAGNLDMHLQGKEGLRIAFSLGEGDICVVEGAMGYFDGIYNTFENSSFHISRELGINSILIYTPDKEMFSAVPKIKGMAEFQGSTIKAVILNRVNETYYMMLKEQIERYTGLTVLGYIPGIKDMELKSRHLGLVQSSEVEDIGEKINLTASIVEKNINLDMLSRIMSDSSVSETIDFKNRNITAAVAMDRAFSFYYRENLYMLEKTCNVKYFSPLSDKDLPECDLLYLGGGYPEVFAGELEKNKPMLKAIKNFGESGGCIYSECGGFMYLTEAINNHSMVGLFKGKSFMTKFLQRFGYIDIELREDCLLGRPGDKLTGHEFHKSITEIKQKPLYKITKTMGNKEWECGYRYKNVFGAYAHINFLGNMDAFYNMLNFAGRSR